MHSLLVVVHSNVQRIIDSIAEVELLCVACLLLLRLGVLLSKASSKGPLLAGTSCAETPQRPSQQLVEADQRQHLKLGQMNGKTVAQYVCGCIDYAQAEGLKGCDRCHVILSNLTALPIAAKLKWPETTQHFMMNASSFGVSNHYATCTPDVALPRPGVHVCTCGD